MKLLVLGAGGQVGRELCRLAWPTGTAIASMDRAEIDIADSDAVFAAVGRERPEIVINAAATASPWVISTPARSKAATR